MPIGMAGMKKIGGKVINVLRESLLSKASWTIVHRNFIHTVPLWHELKSKVMYIDIKMQSSVMTVSSFQIRKKPVHNINVQIQTIDRVLPLLQLVHPH